MIGESQATGPVANSARCDAQPKSKTAPDGGWGWMVVFGSFMIHVITDGVTYSFGIFYDEFLSYFNEGKGRTAWILSILVGVTFCSGPISSMMVNRWGCRTVTIIGAVLASVCLALSVFATNIFYLYFTVGLGTGLGFGLIYLPAIVCVSHYFEDKRSLATGIAVCGSGFGTFIFAPTITYLVKTYDWKVSILVVGVITFSCVIFGFLFRPLPDELDDVDRDALNNLDLKKKESQMNLQIGSYSNFYLASGSELSRTMVRPWSSGEITSYGSIRNDFLNSSKSDAGLLQSKIAMVPAHNNFYSSIQGSQSCGESMAVDAEKRTFKDMLDVSLFTDKIFILFAISNFLTSIGFNVPYVYIVSRAKSFGVSIDDAGMLLSVIGIANTVGRIILGYLSDKSWVNRLWVYNGSLTLCGLATIMSCFCETFETMIIYSCIYGFLIGAYVGLTSVILVDLLGLEKLTNAFGILLLFQGVASFVGPPIAGELYDALKSYDPGFYVAGVTIALSGLILFFIPCLQKHLDKGVNV